MNKKLTLLVSVFFLVVSSVDLARADWKVNGQGKLIYQPAKVLGNEDEKKEEKTEIKVGENSVKVEKRKDESSTEIRSGGVKIKIENRNGRVKIETEREDGKKEDIGEQDELEIEDENEKDVTKITPGSGSTMVIKRGRTEAQTELPISVNPQTNELVVQTPQGERIVTILPDAAVANLLRNNIIDATSPSQLRLEVVNGETVYKIEGLSKQNFLGVFPVAITKTVDVSVRTGEVGGVQDSFLNRLLDLLSF